jgi:hypothetical protein
MRGMSRIGTGSTTNLINSIKFSLIAVKKLIISRPQLTRQSTKANEEVYGSFITSALHRANKRKLKQ